MDLEYTMLSNLTCLSFNLNSCKWVKHLVVPRYIHWTTAKCGREIFGLETPSCALKHSLACLLFTDSCRHHLCAVGGPDSTPMQSCHLSSSQNRTKEFYWHWWCTNWDQVHPNGSSQHCWSYDNSSNCVHRPLAAIFGVWKKTARAKRLYYHKLLSSNVFQCRIVIGSGLFNGWKSYFVQRCFV